MSHWFATEYWYEGESRAFGISWMYSRLWIQWSLLQKEFVPRAENGWRIWQLDEGLWQYNFRYSSETPTDYGGVVMPACIPAMAAALPFAIVVLSDHKKRLRFKKHKCVQCGYSLASLASDAMCPECGTPQKQSDPKQ